MNTFSHVPPGFRFHPTDEELVDYYLRKKIASKRIDLDVIRDVDLYKIEPWDLQELCKLGTEDQNEWYFFSHKDKKYPTGTRTNRATKAGFWKATGRDKAIYAKHFLVGMRKTLVFYKGRAPNGQKSDWIMHEYRLETNENGTTQEEGWVVSRVFKKRITTVQKMDEHESLGWYDHDQVSFMPDFESPSQATSHQPYATTMYHHHYPSKQELKFQYRIPNDPFLQLPHLESPKVLYAEHMEQISNNQVLNINSLCGGSTNNDGQAAVDQVTDWSVLDQFVASQLSHEDAHKGANNNAPSFQVAEDINEIIKVSKGDEIGSECASISTSSCQIDLWK